MNKKEMLCQCKSIIRGTNFTKLTWTTSLPGCHDKVEADLIDEFEEAHHDGSINRMRKCAETLLPFKVTTVHNRAE